MRPPLKLAAFLDLVKNCWPQLPTAIATPELCRDLRRLNWLRNHWTHFGEMSSSISIEYAKSPFRPE